MVNSGRLSLRWSLGGAEDECTTIRTAPVVKTASNPTSSLSPQQEDHHEAAQTTTAVVATTAATTTTVAASSPLDHVPFCGHGMFQTMVLAFPPGTPTSTHRHEGTSAYHSSWEKTLPRDEASASPPLPYAELSAEYQDNRTIVPCDSGWEYDTCDSHLHSIVDEWNLVCKQGWIVSALAAAHMVEEWSARQTIQSELSQQLAADRVGRRPVLGIWLALLVSAGTALTFANSEPLLATLCFLLSA
ncbi:hypothetical protein MRX96_022576 [Rhipicephalus microplus]